MSPEMAAMQEELSALIEGRNREDVPLRTFEAKSEKLILAMTAEAAKKAAGAGEPPLLEHHAVLAHTKLTEGVLKQGDQELVSLFATERRLVSVRIMTRLESPIWMDERDTIVESVLYADIRRIETRREIRWGEAAVGAVCCAIALLFAIPLETTGWALFILGLAGVLHALLMPGRRVEVFGLPGSEPIRIYAVNQKSARRLLRDLKRRTKAP